MHRVAAKLVPTSLNRWPTSEPCHGQSEVVKSFNYWWKLSESCHKRWWNIRLRVRHRNRTVIIAVAEKIIATSKKARQSRSKVKVMVTVLLYVTDIVFHEFVQCGKTIDRLERHEAFEEPMPRKGLKDWRNKTWMLHRSIHLLNSRSLSMNCWQRTKLL